MVGGLMLLQAVLKCTQAVTHTICVQPCYRTGLFSEVPLLSVRPTCVHFPGERMRAEPELLGSSCSDGEPRLISSSQNTNSQILCQQLSVQLM